MAFGAGIWAGTLGASKNKVAAIISLITKVLRQFWQIGHILGRTRKTNIMIRIIYGSCNGRIILLVVPLFVVPTELTEDTEAYRVKLLNPQSV